MELHPRSMWPPAAYPARLRRRQLALGAAVAFSLALTACHPPRPAGNMQTPTLPPEAVRQAEAVQTPAVQPPPAAPHVPSQGSCPADTAPLQDGCVSVSGSRWQLTTHMPGGTRVFLVDLHPGGSVTSHDPVDTTEQNDEWSQQGEVVRFWFNDRYVVHTAVLRDASRMEGQAVNVNQTSWSWSAVRVPHPQYQ